MTAGKGSLPAARTVDDANALLADLIESSESQMHREIARLQQSTLFAVHNQLREECSDVYLRALQLGLNSVEANMLAHQLRSEQYNLVRLQMHDRILALRDAHAQRSAAIRAWHAMLLEQIQTRAAEAARGDSTLSE